MSTCLYCGAELVRKPEECLRDFRKRKYCNRECLHRSIHVKTEHRICIICGKPFTRRVGESVPAFDRRKFCSLPCAAKRDRTSFRQPIMAPKPTPKACLECGKIFDIRSGQKPSDYASKRFCSKSCAAIYRHHDSYIEKTCPVCHKSFTVTRSHIDAHPAKYCSNECASIAHRGVPNSAEHNRNLSRALTGREFSSLHRTRLSASMHLRFTDPAERRKTGIATSKGMCSPLVTPKLRANGIKGCLASSKIGLGSTGTKPERVLQSALDERGILYEIHKPIGDIGIPDLYFGNQRLLVEVDGEYWHLKPKSIERDRRQEKQYRKLGYTVMRFWASEVLEDADRCVDKIVNVLTQAKP